MLWLRLVATALMLAGALAAHAAADFLEPTAAFRFEARALDARTVEVDFKIAPGYYLYREQFAFSAGDATLGAAQIPAGKVKFDQNFDKDVETYHDSVRILIPVQQAGSSLRLVTTSQGCADAGLCYPPMQSGAVVSLTGFGGDGSARVLAADELTVDAGSAAAAGVSRATPGAASNSSPLDAALHAGRFWTIVGVFFAAGLLLSLTPCVLPMIPIVSAIVAGQGGPVSRGRGLTLAAVYSLGMALVYTAFGVAAGLAGEGLAAALQTPWLLALFALGLVAFALSLFGLYELRLPAAFTAQMSQASRRLQGGHVAGVAAMGGISALIVSPCVAAPLAGALIYLSQTRDVWLGGSALFSLAAGMSVPLLLVGASAGALLPRTGAWMEEIKRFFGLLLLGVAIWTVQSVLPAAVVLGLWGALAIGAALLLLSGGQAPRAFVPQRVWRGTAAAVLGVFGLLQLLGAASGGSDPLQPLAHLAVRDAGSVAAEAPRFAPVRSVEELDRTLREANRPVMLDFYADWCVSCKEMERYTFSDPAVQQKLAGALLLKADVTGNTPQDRELLKRFRLFGPPGTIFFDAQGREIPAARLIGYQDSQRFLATLASAGL